MTFVKVITARFPECPILVGIGLLTVYTETKEAKKMT
jgi:hypothetical protein